MTNDVTFTTALFVREHGKEPKGFSAWDFEADFGETRVVIHHPGSVTHGKAKQYAIREARAIAVREGWTGSIEVATLP